MKVKRGRVLFTLLCMTAILGCQLGGKTEVPVSLIGVWKTDELRYSDRPFEITKDTIILEHGGRYFNFVVYPIVDVRATNMGRNTQYDIIYTLDSGLEYEFSFYFYPDNGGVIEFKNQKGFLWKRQKSRDHLKTLRGI